MSDGMIRVDESQVEVSLGVLTSTLGAFEGLSERMKSGNQIMAESWDGLGGDSFEASSLDLEEHLAKMMRGLNHLVGMMHTGTEELSSVDNEIARNNLSR
jgi:uncharacterized protein YukE